MTPATRRLSTLAASLALGFAPGPVGAAEPKPPPGAAESKPPPRPPTEEEAARARAAEQAAARAAAQRALNERVMARDFDPGDLKKIDEEVEAQLKKRIVPVQQAPPAYWQAGWTCQDLLQLRPIDWVTYRRCRYYHRYYGRIWR